ncbi:MAG: hypothetical protein LQ340_004392 [Diploschistes diacapsis]|nr:MAG: hypothetical protein LQ340_004392 [Diploschistes diacapsis]
MPPSQVSIAVSSLNRLVKEEKSYHKELEQQQARVTKLEQSQGDENSEYMIKQERRGIDETKKLFPELRSKIKAGIINLEQQLENDKESGGDVNTEDITKAKEAISEAKTSYREIA